MRRPLHYFYFNLHRSVWSRKYRGKVESHETLATLRWVDFKVSEKGRERVRREGRKNVHAYCAAETWYAGSTWTDDELEFSQGFTEITYNPHKHDSFVVKATGERVESALLVVLRADRRVFAAGLVKG